MMQTRYIIKMKMPARPDLDYFYCGEGKSGNQVFEFNKKKAKRYEFLEQANRDARCLQIVHRVTGETFKVETVRQRA